MSFDIAINKRQGDCQIDVTIRSDSKLVAITGPSGAGKTTALNCIAGLIRPDSGHITIGGRCLFDSEEKIDLPPESRGCGYVFQDSRLFPHKTVLANLNYGAGRAGTQTAPLSLEEAVSLLGLAHLLERKPDTLSGGEIRRVAIGRALLSGPRFLLLDEPASSLDPERAEQIISAIEALRDRHAIPIIYVSHDAAEVARLTDFVVSTGG
ncbi:ATP-binding cassette domain-containing protein [Pontixanthobacter aquaemixtae]|uniref:ATP-binding cassette domain-containing protein n=1 Tax=Pontixanthobacter aquaemixtae TaxID=1958940 RepID=A0A844ZTW9_9SPHN|nr:ATP-binding cassette domain-containing protein [Pontixanthobacter aquaemixtae]MXO90914.1 ATP-binding cassette domain-containing protein [Pontixanthobacter aquaemixtae]